jgi:hypothetical protein
VSSQHSAISTQNLGARASSLIPGLQRTRFRNVVSAELSNRRLTVTKDFLLLLIRLCTMCIWSRWGAIFRLSLIRALGSSSRVRNRP